MRVVALTLLVFLPTSAGAQSADEVANLQAKLRFLGYGIETISGIFGPQTRRAVEAFEFSVGMGDEGRLDEGEMALLNAQVAVTAFERFGYRLVGYWSAKPCEQAQDPRHGLWLDDLAWIVTPQQHFPLAEIVPSEPIVIDTQRGQRVLDGPYFAPVQAGADIRFFPLERQMLVIADEQVHALTRCQHDLAALPFDLSTNVLEYGPPILDDVN